MTATAAAVGEENMNAMALLALLLGVAGWGDSPCALRTANRELTDSTSCLSCHDGSAGAAVGVGRGTHSHPVGVSYADATASRINGLSPTIPGALTLVSGRVECTTCHDGKSTERARLATSMLTLCEDCHSGK